MLITVDGIDYDVIESGITRSFKVLDDENTGRLLNGGMYRSLIGTYYNYTWQIEPRSVQDYDAIYETLSAPVESHTITVPYGQTTKTFEAYVTSGEDTLERIENGTAYWSGMTIQFVAMEPNRTPEE